MSTEGTSVPAAPTASSNSTLTGVAHTSDRPLPTRDAFSGPFWDAAQREELLLQRCDRCGTFRYYPRPICPRCRSTETTWTRCSGLGSVYTFTVVRRPLARWFAAHVPLVCAVVQLDEGPRMVTDIGEVDPAECRIGMRVEVTFEPVDESISLPLFRPTDRDR